jgi:mRNA-degrading endonuclease RelE of RelBE toxin-antitoxin system
VAESILALAADPRPMGYRALAEGPLKGSFRIHVGRDHCVGYDIDDKTRHVSIWQVGSRRGFYDKAKRRRK